MTFLRWVARGKTVAEIALLHGKSAKSSFAWNMHLSCSKQSRLRRPLRRPMGLIPIAIEQPA